MDGQRIVIAGGSGFVGQGLIADLPPRFDDVVVLTRGPARTEGRVRYVNWDAKTPGEWSQELDHAAALVNLVGRTVDCRKTDRNKRVILESRVNSVAALRAALAQCTNPPPVWVQSGTAHIFGDTGDEILDDSSPIGEGFAPMVGTAWEKALNDLSLPATRRVILRISFVIGRDGGAMSKLVPIAKSFLGGAAGTGRQYISWIHQADLNRIILRAIDDPRMDGAYVVTAPNPVTNAEFMRTLRRAAHRPWSPPVPAPLVRVGSWLLRTDPELVLLGRRIVPARLLREGFHFEFPTLEPSLADLLRA